MRLLEAKYHNIFSLGDVTIPLANRGLVLVTGWNEDNSSCNGAGKSSVANKGILWVLFGATAGGIKADNVVNRHGEKKSGWGEVTFIGQDGKTYRVRRSRPSKLELWQDGQDISAKLAKTTQEMVEQVLGRSLQTFVQTEMFGQGQKANYPSLSSREQKEILEQILPINVLEQWAQYTKSVIHDVKGQEREVSSTLLRQQGKVESLTDVFRRLRLHSNEWEAAHASRLHEYETILTNLEGKREQLAKESARQQQYIEEYKEAITKFHQEIAQIEASITMPRAELTKYFDQAQEVLNKWRIKMNTAKAKLDRLTPREEGLCPTCGHVLDSRKAEEIAAERQRLEHELKEASESEHDAGVARTQYYNMMSEVEKRQSAMTILQDNIRLLEHKTENTRNRIQSIEYELKDLGSVERTKLAEEQAAINPHLATMAETQASLDALLPEVEKLSDAQQTLTEELEHLEFWKKMFSEDMKLEMLRRAAPILDVLTERHLQKLGNSQLRVNFSTIKILASGEQREDFNVKVWNESGGDGFDSLSGGEQQIVSFAIGRALSDLARMQMKGDSEFQILDEPFSMLDDKNSEAIVNYLTAEKTDGTILLISNEDHLKGLIPERIHVVKSNGVSRVL